jgi:hypothetical protein
VSDLTTCPLRAGNFELFKQFGAAPASGVGVRSRTFTDSLAAAMT